MSPYLHETYYFNVCTICGTLATCKHVVKDQMAISTSAIRALSTFLAILFQSQKLRSERENNLPKLLFFLNSHLLHFTQKASCNLPTSGNLCCKDFFGSIFEQCLPPLPCSILGPVPHCLPTSQRSTQETELIHITHHIIWEALEVIKRGFQGVSVHVQDHDIF